VEKPSSQDSALPHAAIERPSDWVSRFAGLIPDGEVLDLACGRGRHARLLAGLGHAVLAVDRDVAALECAAGPSIATLQIDLENGHPWPFEPGRFSGIVVTNYLHRPLMPFLVASLAESGVLIYETFAFGNEQFGRPSNPDFLLGRGELLGLTAPPSDNRLQVVAFEDGYVGIPKPAVIQRICAVKCGGGFSPERARLN
jgi:SAM-dependent methyltransferase